MKKMMAFDYDLIPMMVFDHNPIPMMIFEPFWTFVAFFDVCNHTWTFWTFVAFEHNLIPMMAFDHDLIPMMDFDHALIPITICSLAGGSF